MFKSLLHPYGTFTDHFKQMPSNKKVYRNNSETSSNDNRSGQYIVVLSGVSKYISHICFGQKQVCDIHRPAPAHG